jgi:hypothetical protein
MTDYPYTFYIYGFNNSYDAAQWCCDKFGHWGPKETTNTWRAIDIHNNSDSKISWIRRFDFTDSKDAFEFALHWV